MFRTRKISGSLLDHPSPRSASNICFRCWRCCGRTGIWPTRLLAWKKRLLQTSHRRGGRKSCSLCRAGGALGDESFAKREAADRALRTGNAGAIAYLRQLDVNHLDTEQQLRVGRILEAMAVQNGDDSVDQVAATLAADPALWMALLARPDPSTRRTAARELARLLGQSIPVDPAADPDSQKAQREQLRVRIAEREK